MKRNDVNMTGAIYAFPVNIMTESEGEYKGLEKRLKPLPGIEIPNFMKVYGLTFQTTDYKYKGCVNLFHPTYTKVCRSRKFIKIGEEDVWEKICNYIHDEINEL